MDSDNSMLAQNLQQIEGIGLPGFKWASAPLGYILSYGLLPYIFGAAGIALLIYLVFGGFQLMLAKGDPKAIQGAQAKITNALIGFIIVVISYTLTRLIGQIFGISAINNIFK